MATTRIMPLHVGKGRTESRAISDIIDYVANPQKTDGGKLITGFACDSRTADAEFLLAKRQYIAATGRVRGKDDVIAYHVRQSFVPGEITPEEANRLGVEFAKRFTKGKHAFVVCTHIDKAHVHNHIIWSAVTLDCDRKFRNFWGSTKAVRRLSDTICIENGLSVVKNPKPHAELHFLFELMERRSDTTSTIFCTQYRKDDWVKRLGEGVRAEAIVDRYAYTAFWIETGSTNMREYCAKHKR